MTVFKEKLKEHWDMVLVRFNELASEIEFSNRIVNCARIDMITRKPEYKTKRGYFKKLLSSGKSKNKW